MTSRTNSSTLSRVQPHAWARPARRRFQSWRRLARNRLALLALAIIVLVTGAAIFAPLLAPFDPAAQETSLSLRPPLTSEHLLGTDQYGRDVLSRLLFGARVSLSVGLVAVIILIVLGAVFGAVAGYYGGNVDSGIMRFVDVMLSIPQFFLLLAVVAVFGPSLPMTMLIIGLTSWMGTARLVRGQFLSLRVKEFVTAAKVVGASDVRIIHRHLLVNTMPVIIIQAALSLSFAILVEASLSYLGLGAQPPTASWGNMLSDGKNFMRTSWWLTVFPGLAVFLTVLAFNVLGDALREALDPRLKV
ncbi:MAG: ABC transporter permease [Anaerolineae bacterium]